MYLRRKFMMNTPGNSNSQSEKLNAKIKETYSKLTPEEIGFYKGNSEKFFAAVQTKHSINKDEAVKTLNKLDAECAVACSADKASAPVAKAS
jgi:uncharacterized protein YjbJ (UPF0337 family)